MRRNRRTAVINQESHYMSLLECLVGLALSLVLVGPLIKNSGEMIAKQIQYEKIQALNAEAERAMELIGRAIRMAGYQRTQSFIQGSKSKRFMNDSIQIQKRVGFGGSDTLIVKHELSHGVDFDCIGNVLSIDRTKNHLAQQGFLVDRQASVPKGVRVNGGSLMCQSLDRQGRLQNTTLMNGVNQLSIEELAGLSGMAYKVRLKMTDGASLQGEYERIFFARNLS
jgi:type II secretory pathway component PulJ